MLQKWPAPEFCAETKMNLSGLKDGDTAGYISLGMKYIAISVTKNNEKYEMKFVRGLQDFDCDVAYTDEKVEKITALKDADFAEAKAGRWVGVKSGMFACHDNSIKTEAGYVTVDYVEYK